MEANHSIRAVIWDMGGVLVRTEEYTSREKLAEQFHISRKELERAVFDSEISWQAQNGHEEFETRFWEGDRLDSDLVELISDLRPKFCTGLLSNAWPDAPASLERRYGPFLSIFDITVFSSLNQMATEVSTLSSNTGQSSESSPIGQVAESKYKFARNYNINGQPHWRRSIFSPHRR